MKHAIIFVNESLSSLTAIPGHGAIRIPTGGKIHAGIKVLKKKATEHPTAKDISDRGVGGNQSFDEIERALRQAVAAATAPRGKATATRLQRSQQENPHGAGQRSDALLQESAPSMEQVVAAAREFGVDAVRYAAYAERHWGPGWMLNANGRRRALDEIHRYKNDPHTFIDKIDAELKAAQKPV